MMIEQDSTKSIKKMQQLLDGLDKSSPRYQAIEVALQFKSNWVKLGEKLYEIFKTEEFKQWGFPSFERYCAQEIGIRKKTAEKLTTSYYYLKEYEPKLLNEHAKTEIPDYNTIDILAKAKQDERLAPEKYEELKQAVFEEGETDKSIKKRYNEYLDEIDTNQEDIDVLEDENTLSKRTLTSLIQSFEKLDRKAEDIQGLPTEIKADIRKVLVQLKTLL